MELYTTATNSGSIFFEANKAQEKECYLFSVIGYCIVVEAYLNEYSQLLVLGRKPKECERQQALSFILPELEELRTPLKKRIEVSYRVLTGKDIDWGSCPNQGLNLLFQIRNQVAHPRPVKIEFASLETATFTVNNKLFKQLFNVNPDIKLDDWKTCDWYKAISSNEVAEWAKGITIDFVKSFYALIPESTGRADFIRRSMRPRFGDIIKK